MCITHFFAFHHPQLLRASGSAGWFSCGANRCGRAGVAGGGRPAIRGKQGVPRIPK